MAQPHLPAGAPAEVTPEGRLEQGEVLFYPAAPFALPQGTDHEFLLQQEQAALGHKNISYNPHTGKVSGFVQRDEGQAGRLAEVFAAFSGAVTAWLGYALPRYRSGCAPDRASFRPLEEATRRLRSTARNDLLHIDAFPSRPARGRRILRVFANINPTEPRIWVTSDSLPQLLARYGKGVASGPDWLRLLGEGLIGLFRPAEARHAPSDLRMRRLHDRLKHSLQFQTRAPRRRWTFPPGSAWVVMTDGCTHAELRGRFALEHSFFVSPSVLVLPQLAPAALLGAA
jgi:hypothetical protein